MRAANGAHGKEAFGLGVVAVLLATATVACQAVDPVAGLPSPPSVVEVTLDEYRIDHTAPVPAGRVVFDVRNDGEEEHELLVVSLPEDFPPIDVQLASDTRQTLFPRYVLPTLIPGEHGTFAVDLGPGRYGMVCFLTAADDEDHARKGMHTEFRIES